MSVDTKTLTLSEFLLARIAEDEAEANAATVRVAAPNWLAAFREDDGQRTLVMDSDRLVADCEAKRRIVEHHRECATAAADPAWGGSRISRERSSSWVAALDPVLAFLALPYADHPDYDESWRP